MKIKICCIKSVEEARIAIDHGASALGLVGPMPSGPGPIDVNTAGNIRKSIPEGIHSFYLTSNTSFEDIAEEYKLVQSTHLQLTDHTEEETRLKIRAAFSDLKIVQVVHVIDEREIDLAIEYASSSDYLLLDSGAPQKSTKELGGTGRTHNWDISRKIIEAVDIPVFLAGGINASNVADAIARVQPHGIDLCSGVRTDDVLNREKLKAFFDAIPTV